MKLDKDEFGKAHGQFHPEIKEIMCITDTKMVLQLHEDNTMV